MRPTKLQLDEKHRLHALGLRRCSLCNEVLPLEQFSKYSRDIYGLQTQCSPCKYQKWKSYGYRDDPIRKEKERERGREYDRLRTPRQLKLSSEENRRRNLWSLYKITPAEYDEILVRQGGGCAICGATESQDGKALPVDHDHDTGQVRGILCLKCNRALGLFCDDAALLDKAAEYRRKF